MSKWNPDDLIQAEIDSLSLSLDALRAVNRTLREACKLALEAFRAPTIGNRVESLEALRGALEHAEDPFVDEEGDTVEDLSDYVVSDYVPFVA